MKKRFALTETGFDHRGHARALISAVSALAATNYLRVAVADTLRVAGADTRW